MRAALLPIPLRTPTPLWFSILDDGDLSTTHRRQLLAQPAVERCLWGHNPPPPALTPHSFLSQTGVTFSWWKWPHFGKREGKGKNPLPLLGAELCSTEAAGPYHSQLLRGGTARQEAPGTVGVGVRKGQLLHLQQSAGNRDFGYHSTILRRSDC